MVQLKAYLATWPKMLLAIAIQLLAFVILITLIWLLKAVITPPYPQWSLTALVFAQGILSAFLSCRLGLPCWWRYIQFSLPVGLYFGVSYQLSGWWALAIAIGLWLVFANASKERVPLYLTNKTTQKTLKKLIKHRRNVNFLDLGCGLGGNVVFMSQQVNVRRSDGVETAPLPYLISKFFTLFRGGEVYAMDLWKTDLSQYDVVYAFLSPEPMPKLWQKVADEMQPGSVFVSNSFAVPDIEPSEIWELNDSRKTKLYLYNR